MMDIAGRKGIIHSLQMQLDSDFPLEIDLVGDTCLSSETSEVQRLSR